MLKQTFRRGEKLQEKVVLLSNLYNNKLDNFVNSFNKKNIIYQ